MENHDAEAKRHFNGMSLDEKLEALWFAARELHGVALSIDSHQKELNGTSARTANELAIHLRLHEMEKNQIEFVRKWGSRGTGLLAMLISAGTVVIVAADRIWG